MKKVLKNKIINIKNTDKFDNKFNFSVLNSFDKNQLWWIKIIYLSDLLEKKKNIEMLEKAKTKPASYSNVYSPKDELKIFKEIFENAIKNKQKTLIVWITLKEELEILEKYYEQLWFFNEEINCFSVDFSKVLVCACVKIENLMWRWSDYKRMWKSIFFNPPIRESKEVKAMFKWINRGSIAGIYFSNFEEKEKNFLQKQIIEENIIPINLAKVLFFNLIDFEIKWKEKELIINY